MANCINCEAAPQNTGFLNGDGRPVLDVSTKIFMIRLVADDGTINSLETADLNTLAVEGLSAAINNTDPSKRLFPLPLHRNNPVEQAENIMQEFDNRDSILIADSVKPFMFSYDTTPPSFKGVLDSFRCGKWGFYYVDKCKNLVGGKVSNDLTALFPIPIMEGSLNSLFKEATHTTVATCDLMFNLDQSVSPKDFNFIIDSVFINEGVDLESLRGLIDIQSTSLTKNVGNTEFTVNALRTVAGGIIADSTKGRLIQNFAANLELVQSPSTVVTPTSVAETSAGTYLFTFGSAQANGTYFARVKSTVKGFSDAALKNKTVVVS